MTSVHAFATDPKRGVFILVILAITVGGSLLLYAIRAPRIRDTGQFEPVSREGALLLNNIVLMVAAASVLLGTLYPLVLDALDLGKISVGPPYFNTVVLPLLGGLGLVLGIGPIMHWKRQEMRDLARRIGWAPPVALVLAGVVVGWRGGEHSSKPWPACSSPSGWC